MQASDRERKRESAGKRERVIERERAQERVSGEKRQIKKRAERDGTTTREEKRLWENMNGR